MIKENIVKLCDEDLAEICGGDGNFNPVDEAKKAAIDESVKFGIGLVAVPVGAFLSTMAIWGAKLLTDKLDQRRKRANQTKNVLPTPTLETKSDLATTEVR